MKENPIYEVFLLETKLKEVVRDISNIYGYRFGFNEDGIYLALPLNYSLLVTCLYGGDEFHIILSDDVLTIKNNSKYGLAKYKKEIRVHNEDLEIKFGIITAFIISQMNDLKSSLNRIIDISKTIKV